MNKIFLILFSAILMVMAACHQGSNSAPVRSSTTASPDSVSNNGVLPPSSSPDNANNSSMADSAYHKDSMKVKKP